MTTRTVTCGECGLALAADLAESEPCAQCGGTTRGHQIFAGDTAVAREAIRVRKTSEGARGNGRSRFRQAQVTTETPMTGTTSIGESIGWVISTTKSSPTR